MDLGIFKIKGAIYGQTVWWVGDEYLHLLLNLQNITIMMDD